MKKLYIISPERTDFMNIPEPYWAVPVWKKTNMNWRSSLHSMCTYLAMFPPVLPHYFIKQFTEPGDIVFDPFSGRGTAPLEACLNKRIGIGNDLNPLASVLTGAKVNIPIYYNVMNRLSELEKNYIPEETINVEENIKMLYDEEITLPMLVYFKKNLKIYNKVDRFIMGVLLGIMHGKWRKDGSSMYLSINMPNTFSMSPNYIKCFVEENNLKKIQQNVFKLLRERIDYLYPKNILPIEGKSYRQDAIKVNNNFAKESVDLIITSPPYLRVIKYGKYNWIRLWMLDKDSKTIDDQLKQKSAYESSKEIKLSDNLDKEEYFYFMRNLIVGWERILKKNSIAIIVIGDVENYHGRYLNLGEKVWDYVKDYTSLKFVTMIEDKIEGNDKLTRIWGNEKKGNATKVERILILSKGQPRAANYSTDLTKIFSY